MQRLRQYIAALLVAGAAGSAQAQDRPRVEVSGGYQLLKLRSDTLDAAGAGTFFPVGWFLEAAVPVSSGLTLAGQLGGHYRSESAPSVLTGLPGIDDYNLNVHTFLAGPRIVGRREDGLTAFFHLLAGTTRLGLTQSAPLPGSVLSLLGADGTTTRFTLQAGGGFDFPLPARWKGRMTADYLRVSTADRPVSGVRVAIGWVVPIPR